MFRRITPVAPAVVVPGSIAHAITLSTPTVAVDVAQTNMRVVINVGATPAGVSVEASPHPVLPERNARSSAGTVASAPRFCA